MRISSEKYEQDLKDSYAQGSREFGKKVFLTVLPIGLIIGYLLGRLT
jgi:hypothetical protein